MANRILIGRHPNMSGNPYGLFVSKPTKDVTGTTNSDFLFRSNITESVGTVTSLNGQSLTVKYQGSTDINLESSGANQRQKTSTVVTWNRSDFNDGTNDRCPLVLVQTSIVDDTTKQNCMGYFWFKNSSTDYLTAQGFHFEVFPYKTTTTGSLYCTVNAELYANSVGAWPGTSTATRKIYYAICDAYIGSQTT